VRLHLQAARQRGARIVDLLDDLAPEQAAWLEAQYRAMPQPEPMFLVQAAVAGLAGRVACALQFREGVLFTLQPQAAQAAGAAPRATRAPASAPTLTPVAVLVATLHDADGLWVKLTAQEYFELLNEVAAELERIFGQHHGRRGAQAGDVLVSYFLPDADGRYLWNALAAAQQTRDAMRQVSRRWHLRKGWDVELAMDIGLDEGQDWIGALGASAEGELRVLGDAPERATQLSRSGRVGTVLVTRNLLGKLSADERERLTYGVPRPEGAAAEGPLLFTFARLQDIAAPLAVPARFADLAVAELLDLEFPTTTNPAARKQAD
jgi:class 3 adenylate cyclase